jgi:hypothetical protein
MTSLTWDAVEGRLFEAGLDRGVLYPCPPGCPAEPGVPWNGLISVDVQEETLSASPLYFDGVKTFDSVTPGDFSASVKAITYPNEFNQFDGFDECETGLYLSAQPRGTFGLSYRTLLGNDVNTSTLGYKIHIMYNLTAVADSHSYETISSDVLPISLGWKVTSTPEQFEGFKPTGYVVINSTRVSPSILSYIEGVLYGTELKEPRILRPTEVIGMIDNDTGWVA